MANQSAGQQPVLFMVEDEEDAAALIKMTMAQKGYEVLHLTDGLQAQQQIAAMPPPALVLLDLGLPHVSGLELLAQIRKKPTWGTVPVVMLTASADKTDICKAIVAGATDYILKPFKPETLSARLERVHAASRNRRVA